MTQIRLGTPGDAARERELWQLAFGDDGAYVDNFYQTYYKPERMLLLEEDGVVQNTDQLDGCAYELKLYRADGGLLQSLEGTIPQTVHRTWLS